MKKKIESDIEIANFASTLSKEQKKKYRKQYIKLMIRAGLFTVVFGVAMFESIAGAFIQKSLILLGLSIVFAKNLLEQIVETKDEIELIQERIIKRSKKNKKQNKK